MKSFEFQGLARLNIPVKKWGSDYRVRVKNQTGRLVYITNISHSKNIKLIAKHYKLSEERIRKNIDPEYISKHAGTYHVENGQVSVRHIFENFDKEELISSIKRVLMSQNHAFKVNIQLGYILINKTDPSEEMYFSPSWNTSIFDKNIAVSKASEIEKKVVSSIRHAEIAEKVKYPGSKWELKEIVSAHLIVYPRNFRMGDGDKIVIPQFIKKNRFIIDFPKTNNKCVFYCIAYHLSKNPRKDRMFGETKEVFKRWCAFKNIEYTFDVFKNFQPIDVWHFDQLEECFNIGINVFEVDDSTNDISKLVTSNRDGDIMNIIVYKNHAMYITDTDIIMNKYSCNRCEAIFPTADKLKFHKRSKCAFETLDRFVKDPTLYKGRDNILKQAIERYCFGEGLDHYLDHYIVYDFESYPLEIAQPKIKDGEDQPMTVFTHRHVPMSVSICDSLTNKAKCFINKNPRDLLINMFEYINLLTSKIGEFNINKFSTLLKAIDDKIENLKANTPEGWEEYHQIELEIDTIKTRLKEDFESDEELQAVKDSYKEAKSKKETLIENNSSIDKFNKSLDRCNNDRASIEEMIVQIPMIGFNSGRYDINLIKKDLFAVLHKLCGLDKSPIKNPSYMCINTPNLKILDISNFLPPKTSYAKYLKTYIGECECKDKITCLCDMSKGHFPHEYMASKSSEEAFAKLAKAGLPAKSAFRTKGENISDDDYKHLQFIWKHKGMKTLEDLLIWYNNLDCSPFIRAIAIQREFYKGFGLDMFADAVSLPGLAEKIMYNTCYNSLGKARLDGNIKDGIGKPIFDYVDDLDSKTGFRWWKVVSLERAKKDRLNNSLAFKIEKDGKSMISLVLSFNSVKDAIYVAGKVAKEHESFCPELKSIHVIKPKPEELFSFPNSRMKGYRDQDAKAKREFNLTIDHLNNKLTECDYLCSHCECVLTEENVSADRIDNRKGHVNGNVIISCIRCNVSRKDMPIGLFRKMIFNKKHGDKLIWSIDEANKDIFYKMKENIAGGPSIVFHRYHKRNETFIRNGSKLCKKVVGYDANALYLGCLGSYMPCGQLTTIEPYDSIIDDIRSDKLFGFLECDIETPEELKDYFGEMTPIFKNTEIDQSVVEIIGDHMSQYGESINRKPSVTRKLIGSYFGKKILIYTPLLKWYLEHGLIITKTYSFIKCSKARPFKSFMDKVADARRAGNADKSKKLIGDSMKLVGNSPFGRAGMDKSKHKTTKYETDVVSARSIIEKQNFHDIEELEGMFEITLNKRTIFNNNPIHVSIAIYQLAKLRMLEFYYDFIDYYFDRSDFQYIQMDTDSAYIAFSAEDPFQSLIKPHLRDHFEQNRDKWLPRIGKESYDNYTPGLFKEEWRGDAMVALSPKNYTGYFIDEVKKEIIDGSTSNKLSAKGVQKDANKASLKPDKFEEVVKTQTCMKATNKGFRIDRGSCSMVTYTQTKIGLNYWYDKRRVLADGITTVPLNI